MHNFTDGNRNTLGHNLETKQHTLVYISLTIHPVIMTIIMLSNIESA